MSTPRAILPGRTYFITRRCTQRQFLLRPDKITNETFLYCLAEAAERYGIEVHAVVALSNHYHAIVHDPHGQLPAFLAHFHKLIAKVMNCRWGRWENFFAAEPTCAVVCERAEDVFDKMVYTHANGVKEHLVERAHHWPGASSLAAQLNDKELEVRRPYHFFDADGSMPETVRLRFIRPHAFAYLSHERWCSDLTEAIAEVEAAAAAERRETGRRILGRRAVREQSPFDWPSGSEPRRNLRPKVACRSKWHRIEALARNATFLEGYRSALGKLKAGIKDVLFPAGTYLLVVRGLVCCEPLPAPS